LKKLKTIDLVEILIFFQQINPQKQRKTT